MNQMSGGQAVVETLRAEGVTHVFGLIGSATMELFDALYDAEDIQFIGVRDERTGTHMADGYARASGKPGVILAGQNGPGTTNLVTGLAQAKAAFSPVVALAGMLSTDHIYRDAFQEVDQQALFAPITKRTWTVPSADRVCELTREAFRTANSPRKGPVLLNLPRNVLSAQTDMGDQQRPDQSRAVVNPAGDSALIAQAAKLLAGADRPVIVAGGEKLEVPAEPVANVVDTTGAGDLYAAGFLRGYTQGRSMTDCARLGGVCASEVISHMGARPENSLAELAGRAGL